MLVFLYGISVSERSVLERQARYDLCLGIVWHEKKSDAADFLFGAYKPGK